MENTAIEWTDHTINFWWGCTKVSPGCEHCYAETLSHRWGKDIWGPGKPREDHRAGATKLALKLNQQAAKEGRRFRIFSASMSDWLDDEIPTAWLADLLALIHATPNLDWLLLTKRPQNFFDRLKAAHLFILHGESTAHEIAGVADWLYAWGKQARPPANVWIGTTVEDQTRADQRIPALLQIPARIRFLSCEPLLGPVDLRRWTLEGLECSECAWVGCESLSPGEKNYPDSDPEDREFECPECGGPCGHTPIEELLGNRRGLHWLIAGGESGPQARPMHPDWARSLRDQCAAAGLPFFFKQWGEFKAADSIWQGLEYTKIARKERPCVQAAGSPLILWNIGKKAAGRLLDGQEWSQFPALTLSPKERRCPTADQTPARSA